MENSSRKDNKGWKDNSYIPLLGEKGWRMMRAKNKSTTPSLTFPFALFINKTGNLAEKTDMHFGGSGINKTC